MNNNISEFSTETNLTTNLCRMCLSDKNNMLNLSEISNFANSFTLLDIMNFYHIKITDKDMMPRKICSNCCIILNNTFEFRSFVQKCDSILKDHLKDNRCVLKPPDIKFSRDITVQIPKHEHAKLEVAETGEILTLLSTESEHSNTDRVKDNKNYIKVHEESILLACNKTETDNKNYKRLTTSDLYSEKSSDSDNVLSNYVKPKKKIRRRKNQDIKQFECPICLKTFSMRCRMQYHLQIHGEKTEKCPSCDRKFKHKREVTVHMKIHGGSEKFQCEYCALWYSSSANLCKHIRIKHRSERGLPPPEPRERTHLCHMCPKGFFSATSLNSHLVTHREERNFDCPVCHKKFISQNYVHKHMTIHNSSQDYECSVCFKRFGQAKNLKDHMVSHSGLKEFICHICTRAFARKNELKMHMKIHRNEKDILCPECPMRFTQLGNMRRHLATHRDKHGDDRRPRDHLCHVCSKGFTTKELLCTHIKTHSDIREYACNTCGARFRTKAILQGHVETHNTIKSYVCEVCNKGFTKDKYLKVHMRSHSKERNFECLKCNSGFATSYLLSLHQKQHEGVFHDYCFPCNKGYMARSSFDKHLQSKEHLRVMQETIIT